MKSESQIIEYKENWRDEYLKWICGFANAQGGTLYIGVNDDKQIIGVKNSKQLMEDIPNKIVATMGIVPDVNLLTEGDKDYIQIVVEQSNMPIAYKGQYHYRSGSTKQELKGIALQQFLLKKMGRTWDDVSIPNTSIADVDRNAVDYFLRMANASGRIADDELKATTEDVLNNLGLLEDNGNLKAAALLLFTKNPKRYFPGVEFKIGRFHTTESDLIIQDAIGGNILQMPEKVMEALKSKYLVSPIHYEGMQRIETLEIPEKGLREAIYNSIVHKDYTGAPIQMRVYDDHIELWNDGLLPHGITIDQLFVRHSSHPRNKNIANAFFQAGFIESWGRGYQKITEELRKVGLPKPIVEETEGGVRVSIKRRSMEEIIAAGDGEFHDGSKSVSKDVSKRVSSDNRNVNDYVIDSVTDKFGDLLTKRQKAIVGLIKDNPFISIKEMALTISVADRTIARDLSIMQKAKIIRREGSDRSGIWVILESFGKRC